MPKSEPLNQENRMGTVPIPKLMITMGAPMMLSMLVQALYNVTVPGSSTPETAPSRR